MASHFYLTFTPSYNHHHHRFLDPPIRRRLSFSSTTTRRNLGPIRVSDGGDSYLGMWKKAMERERKEIEFRKVVENVAEGRDDDVVEDLETKSSEFLKILEVPKEERDRVQRTQVIDRAAAAIAVVSTILREEKMGGEDDDDDNGDGNGGLDAIVVDRKEGNLFLKKAYE